MTGAPAPDPGERTGEPAPEEGAGEPAPDPGERAPEEGAGEPAPDPGARAARAESRPRGQAGESRDDAVPARGRLRLTGPVPGSAGEDRPESWGDRAESDADRLGFYAEQRPPHHGG